MESTNTVSKRYPTAWRVFESVAGDATKWSMRSWVSLISMGSFGSPLGTVCVSYYSSCP